MVMPMLALIPLLAGMSGIVKTMATLGSLGFIILVGHFLAHPLFRIIAQNGLRKIFTAFTLNLIVEISVLMSVIGLSPALGSDMAYQLHISDDEENELDAKIINTIG